MFSTSLDAFQVIADPRRRKILHLLSQDIMTINALAENFKISRPAISKHIKILENAGFISIKNMGRERHCTLREDGFEELKTWVEYFDKFWLSRFDNLEQLLNDKDLSS